MVKAIRNGEYIFIDDSEGGYFYIVMSTPIAGQMCGWCGCDFEDAQSILAEYPKELFDIYAVGEFIMVATINGYEILLERRNGRPFEYVTIVDNLGQAYECVGQYV